jgi:diguanylate cyclase (GGDEF)-like protein
MANGLYVHQFWDVSITSAIVVPLVAQGHTLGVLGLCTDSAQSNHRHTSLDLRLIEELAHRIALALDNALLHEKAQRARAEAEALREIMNQIAAELELEPLLHTILERAVELLAATSGQIALYDETLNELEILSCINMDPDFTGTRQPLTERATGYVVQTHQPLIISDYQSWDGRLPQYTALGAQSLLLVPLLAGDQVLGIIITGASYPRRVFNEEDVSLLTMFAQQATIAIRNARRFAEVHHLATIDPLTGLHNRRSFFNLARRAYELAKRYRSPLSIVMLDIDNFKWINDTFGHARGDQVLEAAAIQCRSTLRTADIIGRWGGDEIVIALPETDSESARQVAERLHQTLVQTIGYSDEGDRRATVSLGIATYTDATPSLSLEDLIDQADQALYHAKQAGRNRIIVSDPP